MIQRQYGLDVLYRAGFASIVDSVDRAVLKQLRDEAAVLATEASGSTFSQ